MTIMKKSILKRTCADLKPSSFEVPHHGSHHYAVATGTVWRDYIKGIGQALDPLPRSEDAHWMTSDVFALLLDLQKVNGDRVDTMKALGIVDPAADKALYGRVLGYLAELRKSLDPVEITSTKNVHGKTTGALEKAG